MTACFLKAEIMCGGETKGVGALKCRNCQSESCRTGQRKDDEENERLQEEVEKLKH